MKVLELFAGTCSIGKAFEARGHKVFSVEWDKRFENISLYADINTLTAEDILERFGRPDIIWASPDCATFSIAAISHHRRKNPETGNLDPVSDYAKFCDKVDQHVLELIRELKPAFWFIENPRGGMRKMSWMKDKPRYTVTYCQYGDTRMKPTDIWTNHPAPDFKPMCKNGDPCHVRAPRGSKTGTQGLKGSKERSVIPPLLCEHIVTICEKYHKGGKSMTQTTKETRRKSYEAVRPKVNQRCRLILETLGSREMTVSEITDELVEKGKIPYYNRNYVAPRLTELKDMGVVETCGRRKSTKSQATEAVWKRKEATT